MTDDSISRIAAVSFAEHIVEDAPARSWRLGKPGTGYYSFRVTWARGVLAVSGDIGSAVYEAWPSFGTWQGAVGFVAGASFEYLSEKGNIGKEFDREASAEHLIELAYEYLRTWRDPRYFKLLCREFGGDPSSPQGRKQIARELRDSFDLTAKRIYNMTGDFEMPVYSYPSKARWAYEALRFWAAKMQAASAEVEACA